MRHLVARRYWSWKAPRWHAGMSTRRTAEGVAARAAWFAERHPGRGDLLDLCCGTGAYSRAFAALGFRVVGLDSAQGMIDVATTATVADGDNETRYVLADADSTLPFGAAAFDAAVCIWGLEHTANPARTLAELRRVLRPGGMLLVVTLSADNRFHRRHREQSWIRRWAWLGARRMARQAMNPSTKASLAAIGKAAGFDVTETLDDDRRCVQALFRAT